MSLLDKIKKWPVERKRLFSISLAIFLTFLIIILNISLGQFLREDISVNSYKQERAMNSLKTSFFEIFEQVKPTVNQLIASSTSDSDFKTEKIIDQINTTTSSFSTTSNIVE